MPTVQPADLKAAVDAVAAHHGNTRLAAASLGVARSTLRDRLQIARTHGIKAGLTPDVPIKGPDYVKRLERDLAAAQKESADAVAIKAIIGKISDEVATREAPPWLANETKPSAPGVPTLFLSDFHWGEIVFPAQINGVNRFNLSIARRRLKDTVDAAVLLMRIIGQGSLKDFPGIVVPLGGDMISGDIHEELKESNEVPTMPTVLDLHDNLASAIGYLADEFGQVFLPCVTGNHGRNTRKPYAKNRQFTSFDWLLYQFLARRFADDKRVTFFIPDGPDALYRIYGTRYNLTHGDQFRGGDSMIGPLGPITRGDHKKRSRNSQIDLDYDVLLMGHWHQYIHLSKLIVNGALKGYDEYANTNNFPFERPQQALWVTHPVHGITFRCPVYCERSDKAPQRAWVSVQK